MDVFDYLVATNNVDIMIKHPVFLLQEILVYLDCNRVRIQAPQFEHRSRAPAKITVI